MHVCRVLVVSTGPPAYITGSKLMSPVGATCAKEQFQIVLLCIVLVLLL